MSYGKSNSLQDARADLAAAHRLAVLDGLNEGSWNHFSLTVPGTPDRMLASPVDRHWRQVTASNLVLVDENGDSVEGDGRCDRSAFCIHYPIHVACPQAACVLHAHPPYATALSMVKGGRLLMADQNALALYGRVAYDESYDGFIFDPMQGAHLAELLGDKRVLIMRNHGVLVVGPTVAEAYTDLYHLERACMFQCHAMAMATGRDFNAVSPEIGSLVAAQADDTGYKLTHFAAMRRLLDAEQPDYVN
jgi:ribulose-5-phosphate 4-epimerase/fuculose-1-phosphate aldolase